MVSAYLNASVSGERQGGGPRLESPFDLVGDTPYLRIDVGQAHRARIFVKLEGLNPTGSIKDRACLYLIRAAQEAGELVAGKTLLDASSGNMACAIAYFGRLLGSPVKVVSSSKLTDSKRGFIEYYGAEVELVGDFTIEGNRYCRRLEQEEPERYCFLDQLHSWENPRAYYETLGPEIAGSFPGLAAVVGSLGSGGSLSGAGRYLKERCGGVRVVAVQAAPGTRLPGTGAFDDGDYVTPFIARAFDDGLFDHVVKIDYADAVRRTEQLRDRGAFCGLQTGGVLHAALAAVQKLELEGDVVILSGDSGWKNLDKLTAL